MNTDQQTALESVAGRSLSTDELTAIDALLSERNDVAIAEVINTGATPVAESITVSDVFDILYLTGDYLTLKQSQLSANPLALMAFEVLKDAKEIGSGRVAIQSPTAQYLFGQLLSAGLLSQAGLDALNAASLKQPPTVHYNAVSDALNIAEGRLTL